MNTEGVYRVSGNKHDTAMLLTKFDTGRPLNCSYLHPSNNSQTDIGYFVTYNPLYSSINFKF